MVATSNQSADHRGELPPGLDVGHELGNVALLLDAAIRLTPNDHVTVDLLGEAKRRIDEISRSIRTG